MRKQWTEEQMSAALNSVKTEGLSGNRLYGFPHSRLKYRLSGRVVHGMKLEPRPYLSTGEETELSSHLLQVATENIHAYFDLLRSVYDEIEVTWMKQSTQIFAAFVLVHMTKI